VRKLSGLKEFLWVLSAFGAVAIAVRLLGGLGASTDLSDSMPWGLWKIINMVAGVALATGGFALAATVYIFNLTKYRSVLKPAIVIAFLGNIFIAYLVNIWLFYVVCGLMVVIFCFIMHFLYDLTFWKTIWTLFLILLVGTIGVVLVNIVVGLSLALL